MKKLSEKEMVAGCIEGSVPAWEQFVDEWSRYSFSVIQQTLRTSRWPYSQEDAEDILSQVFVSFVENQKHLFRNFQWRCSLKTWVWMVSRKTAIRYFRRKRWKTIPISEVLEEDSDQGEGTAPPDPNPGPVEQVADKEKSEMVKAILNELPERERLALTYYFYDGASYKEISELLGIKPHYVGTMIFRAKKLLENRLSGKIEGLGEKK